MRSWKSFKEEKSNFQEPEYEKDHGHSAADLNSGGGFDPENEEEHARYKHADLITLPSSVEGTNCSNCKFVKKVENGLNFCEHEDVKMYVTPRMCCKYWDHEDVKRDWGGMDD